MRTLYVFGPAGNLPDASPFITKAMILLTMAGLDFSTKTGGLPKAPKGKLPYLDDNGTIVADSTFIRLYIEKQYGFEFDKHLSPAQRAHAWALEKMCEDHLAPFIAWERWTNDANFNRGMRRYFDFVPALVRPLVTSRIRSDLRSRLRKQGTGRFTAEERLELVGRDMAAISDTLGDKPFLFGNEPCAADAAAAAVVMGALWNLCECPLHDLVSSDARLVAYRDRAMAIWFKDFKAAAA